MKFRLPLTIDAELGAVSEREDVLVLDERPNGRGGFLVCEAAPSVVERLAELAMIHYANRTGTGVRRIRAYRVRDWSKALRDRLARLEAKP